MTRHSAPPKVRHAQDRGPQRKVHVAGVEWQSWVRRIRVPLGFLTAALYLIECARCPLHPLAVVCSLALVLPGLALRAAAAGTVKKNRELTISGPYAYTRNPLYLGSALIAGGFALALLDWPMALLIVLGFAAIYIPVIFSEERFLRGAFAGFDDYCRQVPRFFPRLTPANVHETNHLRSPSHPVTSDARDGFSLALYFQHREYNAALGAALLYLSLLYLRPLMDLMRQWMR